MHKNDSFLVDAVEKLRSAGIENPWREARLLRAHELDMPYEGVFMGQYTPQESEAFLRLIERRLAKEPLSKILGAREFWGNTFHVTTDTLDPRFDTETIIEAVLETIPKRQPLRVLDLGTGSGCILISLLKEYPEAWGVGVDISSKALAVAQKNGELHRVNDRAQWVCSDWGSAISGTFDIIVSNPPYISTNEVIPVEVSKYDPSEALWAGTDGLECYRTIITDLPRFCAHGSHVFFECGYQQSKAVSDMLQTHLKQRVYLKNDMLGIPRVAFSAYLL